MGPEQNREDEARERTEGKEPGKVSQRLPGRIRGDRTGGTAAASSSLSSAAPVVKGRCAVLKRVTVAMASGPPEPVPVTEAVVPAEGVTDSTKAPDPMTVAMPTTMTEAVPAAMPAAMPAAEGMAAADSITETASAEASVHGRPPGTRGSKAVIRR